MRPSSLLGPPVSSARPNGPASGSNPRFVPANPPDGRGLLAARHSGAGAVVGPRNRSRLSPSMMSAVKPAADAISCCSPSCQKTASPASIGSTSPSSPLTSPDPSRTATTCGHVAGCRRSRPHGANRKIAAFVVAPSSEGAVNGAMVTRSSRSPRGANATSSPKLNRSIPTSCLSHKRSPL